MKTNDKFKHESKQDETGTLKHEEKKDEFCTPDELKAKAELQEMVDDLLALKDKWQKKYNKPSFFMVVANQTEDGKSGQGAVVGGDPNLLMCTVNHVIDEDDTTSFLFKMHQTAHAKHQEFGTSGEMPN